VTYTPEQSADNLSWRLSAQYEMTDDINSYATVARGYKGPGFNLSWSGVPGAVPVGKETSMSYEVGIKSTFMQRVLFNASVYYEQFDDFQTQAFAPTVTAGGSFLIQNAGKLEAQGVETSFTYIVGAGLTVSGAASYNEASYKEFQGAPCYTGQTAAQGCSNGVTDASGNRLANAPRWAGTLGADYEHGVSPSLVFLGHGDLFTRSRVNFDPTGDPQTAQAGYGLFNASLGLGAADKRWKAAVFCRNCFDKRYVTFIQANPVGPGDYSQTFAVDSFRTVGVAVDVKF
jgi:iron complex outermembrane receptor protein